MPVQITPVQPNRLADLALNIQQGKRQDRRLDQVDKQIQNETTRLTQAAKQMGVSEQQFAVQLLNEVIGETQNPDQAVQIMSLYGQQGVVPPLTAEMEGIIRATPAEAFGTALSKPKYSAPKEGLDNDGNPAFFQTDQDGNTQRVEGFTPRPKSNETISVGPDGQVTISRGAGAQGLTKTNVSKVESQAVNDSEILAMTRNVMATYRPEYQTISGRFDAAASAFKSKLNIELNQEEAQHLQSFADYKANAAQLQSKVINQLAGAAVSESEADRINGFLINPGSGLFDGDDPITAESKLKRYERNVQWAIARKQWFIKNGIEANEGNWNKHTLESMPEIIKRRHQEIVSELSATNPDLTAAEVTQMAVQQGKQEFGLL